MVERAQRRIVLKKRMLVSVYKKCIKYFANTGVIFL